MNIVDSYKYYNCNNCTNRNSNKCKLNVEMKNKILLARCEEYNKEKDLVGYIEI